MDLMYVSQKDFLQEDTNVRVITLSNEIFLY